jgi:hypothetical protein
MKERRRYSKAASAQLNKESAKIVENIREEAKKYSADCVYNIDKTGKYWKIKPNRSLSTTNEHSKK